MKIRRQLPLDQALEGISTMIEQLRSSTVIIDDHEITPGDPVSLEIEIESEDGSFELEFEIKWRADQQTTQPSESESSPAETPNEGHW